MSAFIGCICVWSVISHAHSLILTLKHFKTRDDMQLLFANISLANIITAVTFTTTLFSRCFTLDYPLSAWYCNHETAIKYTSVFAAHITLYYAAFCTMRQSSESSSRSRHERSTLSCCIISWFAALLITIPRPILFPRIIKVIPWKGNFTQHYCSEENPKSLLYLDLIQMFGVMAFSLIGSIAFSFRTFANGSSMVQGNQSCLMMWLCFTCSTVAWLPSLLLPFLSTDASVSIQ